MLFNFTVVNFNFHFIFYDRKIINNIYSIMHELKINIL